MRRLLTIATLVLALGGLGGCVVAPAPGYYARPSVGVGVYAAPRPYYRPYRPYYRRW